MKIGRSSNPSLSRKYFADRAYASTDAEVMTIQGTINKTLLLLLLAAVSAAFTWKIAFETAAFPFGWVAFGGIGGFIVAMITIFRPQSAAITAPIYAILEGLLLGGISALYATAMSGIVFKAILLTFTIFFAMLFVYKAGLVKVNEKFKTGMMTAMGGILAFYVITWILRIVGVPVAFLHEGGLIGIGISLVIIVIASLMFLWDFDTIEQGVQAGAPKYMEWYSGFSLLLTLVWLYLEILRLLSYLRD